MKLKGEFKMWLGLIPALCLLPVILVPFLPFAIYMVRRAKWIDLKELMGDCDYEFY